MSEEAGDTFARSLAHWSEAGRDEMNAFYEVATLDYRELTRAWGLGPWLVDRAARGPVRILDVACGSGKFPTALREDAAIAALPPGRLVMDLLDPSAFSVAEARSTLQDPMVGGRELVCTLQDLPADATGYDLVWAVHALYALPEAELDAGVAAFLGALAPDGVGFVGHATRSSHYLAFYDAYLPRFRPEGTPYTSGEALVAAFEAAGATVDTTPLHYSQVIRDQAVLEGYLQRCLFDASLSLAAMRADPALGPYLEARTDPDGAVRLDQHVAMMVIRR